MLTNTEDNVEGVFSKEKYDEIMLNFKEYVNKNDIALTQF
jgi:hypothetical protein